MSDTSNLARKLGLVPGCSILLLDAPAPSASLLRDICPPGVMVADTDDGADRYDLIFLWLRSADGLTERFAALQWRIVPNGAIWAMLLKKPIARKNGVTLTWEQMQAAALQTDLVDNKGAMFSDEEYGTRFVIRRDRRSSYATPPSAR
jgi:hypothetical protein